MGNRGSLIGIQQGFSPNGFVCLRNPRSKNYILIDKTVGAIVKRSQRKIYNPVTGKSYPVVEHSSNRGKPGEVEGIWREHAR